ncbi:hypothetical protein [Curtobacterium ammoniigenes]|uniref:hypothetical protein n=1 Tax=Curtobacterium ammoniigenes TaxID=395387 RepID=UPI0008305103|nr:hypothetical protein [Curtobacterium ammoniigenes]
MSTSSDRASRPSALSPFAVRLVIWIVSGVIFAYMLWQAIANFVGVTTSIAQFNAFVRANHATTLESAVPWVALVLDVLIAPVVWGAAWFVSRRFSPGRIAVVFVAALCAASVFWFDLLEYVTTTVHIGR